MTPDQITDTNARLAKLEEEVKKASAMVRDIIEARQQQNDTLRRAVDILESIQR